MDYLRSAQLVISLALQCLLVVLLLLGPVRKYFIVFLYSAVYLITSAVETFVSQSYGTQSPTYRVVYWTDEICLDLLLFTMVIFLAFRATRGSPLRPALRTLLTGLVVAALGLPFIINPFFSVEWSSGLHFSINHPYFNVRWFRQAGQILNFGGAIMNLALWTALIGSKERDPQLLAVSAGLGIAVTGQAIYYGIRLLTTSPLLRTFSDLVGLVTYIAGIAIWCWAFRPAARTARPGPPPEAVQVDA